MTIRKLGWIALLDAQRAWAIKGVRDLGGWGRAFEHVAALGGEQRVHELAAEDPAKSYDPIVLMSRAVLSWKPDRQPPTLESEPDLTWWLAGEILRLSQPSLFKESR